MPPLVLYHASCWDGFCCAWLMSKAFPDAELVPVQYGTDPPELNGRDVYIVDFSYKREIMRDIMSRANRVVILDHHATAEKELAGLCDEFCMRPDLIANPPGSHLPYIRFDMDKSGARLTWEYLYGFKMLPDDWLTTNRSGYSLGVAPWLVDYTEDRDLWRHALPQSRAINAALRSYPLDLRHWDSMSRQPPMRFAEEGTTILRRERQIIDEHKRHARPIRMRGHDILAVNATVLFSEIAGELAEGRPFGACWFERSDRKIQWSLRSTQDGLDVSEIARYFGGGGHKHAAGFEQESDWSDNVGSS